MTRSTRWGGRPRPPLRGWPPSCVRPSEALSVPPCSVPPCLCGLPLFFHPPSLDPGVSGMTLSTRWGGRPHPPLRGWHAPAAGRPSSFAFPLALSLCASVVCPSSSTLHHQTPGVLGMTTAGGVLTGVSGGTMLSPYRLSFRVRHRERGGDMVLGKLVTALFLHAPEGMAAGGPAASAAPSEARAPGSLPAPRHPPTVRDPSLRWVLRRLSACAPRPGLPGGDGAPPANRGPRRPRGVASFRPDARRPMSTGRRGSFFREGGCRSTRGEDRRDRAGAPRPAGRQRRTATYYRERNRWLSPPFISSH